MGPREIQSGDIWHDIQESPEIDKTRSHSKDIEEENKYKRFSILIIFMNDTISILTLHQVYCF